MNIPYTVEVRGASGVAPASPGPRQPDLPRDGDVEWGLRASSLRVPMARRDRWRLTVVVTNRGRTPIDPQMTMTEWTVNGENDITLSNAFTNGAHDASWSSLPPGQTATDDRDLGESLFLEPGEYEIVMTHGAARRSLRVRVTP